MHATPLTDPAPNRPPLTIGTHIQLSCATPTRRNCTDHLYGIAVWNASLRCARITGPLCPCGESQQGNAAGSSLKKQQQQQQ